MTKCEVKRWSLSSTPLDILSQEIEDFLNGGGEVKILQSFVLQSWLILIAIFENA